MLFNWGYSSYMNPYYVPVAVPVVSQPVVYDYSTPIDVQSTPPEQSVSDAALQVFNSARDAFMAGDYANALNLVDQSIAKLPGDATLHEFRALVLFALGRYDEAAAPLYAVLSVGPGWDWTTLIGLYPNIDVYTQQERALETYIRSHPKSAAARFVLAYHYLTQGHTDFAIEQLKDVSSLQPSDKLSAQLAEQLAKGAAGANSTTGGPQPPQQPEQPPPTPTPATVKPGSLPGTWNASPTPDTAITLTIQPDNHFIWKVNQKGQTRQFEGDATYADNILTLAQSQGGAMVGKTTWQNDNRFNFQVMGAAPGDPGLTFTR
jgi:tetratricopeptide (TPR) repeat protein